MIHEKSDRVPQGQWSPCDYTREKNGKFLIWHFKFTPPYILSFFLILNKKNYRKSAQNMTQKKTSSSCGSSLAVNATTKAKAVLVSRKFGVVQEKTGLKVKHFWVELLQKRAFLLT